MNTPRCLFIISADFGEYVTANLFSRGQPLDSCFAIPFRLAPHCDAARHDVRIYSSIEDLERIVRDAQPALVVLCSGYLFSINRLIPPDALARFVDAVRRQGIALATTDPWLRIWELRPQTRFAIYSVSKGGIDERASAAVSKLQAELGSMFADVPHIMAVPVTDARRNWHAFFNPEFVRSADSMPVSGHGGESAEWLFVLSREDLVLSSGVGGARFFDHLQSRIDELMALEGSHVTFIGPQALGGFFGERHTRWRNVTFVPFCDFAAFETAIRRASVVVYWNMLSASLLYCLYYGIPPVFYGKGHQILVCDGLDEHVLEHVYRGKPPALLEFDRPLASRAVALIKELRLERWLENLRCEYASLPSPRRVVDTLLEARTS